MIASVWSGVIHVCLAVLGTFCLKRFPTSFSIGFFLGLLLIIANQNLVLFGVFLSAHDRTSTLFANLSLVVFIILSFFALLLLHFRHDVVVAPIDANAGGVDKEEPA